MLNSTKKRLRNHSRTLALTVGVAGGLYLAGSYALERLRDVQEQAGEERRARESLRRRFIQNQEDCTFTLLALLPTLSSQILTDLDVEQLTHDLQQLSRQNPSLQIPKEDKIDLGESVVSLAGSSAGSDESKGSSGTSGDEAAGKEEKERKMEELKNSSYESWSEEFRMREERSANLPKMESSTHSLQSETSGYLVSEPSESASSPEQIHHSELPGSPLQQQADAPAGGPHATTVQSPPSIVLPPPPSAEIKKSKMELWNELKLLTFTRTLTTVYTLVLLTLHTRIQLNILGRYSYIRSVRSLESTFAQQPPPSTSSWWSTLFGSSSVEPVQSETKDIEIDQETEMVYLTFSWWLMNVGWREVKERVQLAVEEVFGPVSLKKFIDRTDFETLLSEVRRKVEWDLGGDGIPRRHSFASHVLPATPALETHLLISSTLSPPHPPSIDPSSPLRLLLSESLLAFNSPDCQLAFDSALTSAFGGLEDHLATKGLLGEVVDGSATTKGRRLAEVLVEVNSWGKACLTTDQGGLGRNDLIDTLADLPALGAFSATVYSDYDDLLDN